MLTAAVDKYLRNETRPGIVLDIGANVGWLSLYAATLGHNVRALSARPGKGPSGRVEVQLGRTAATLP
jgi:hypothetical protein